jgi:hypothetical protein
MATETSPEGLTTRDALDHAWDWFELHAKQRMDLINYFLVATAFLAAGYAGGIQAGAPVVSAGVSVLGVIIAICFQRIEQRTRELIRLGEAALRQIESAMASETGMSQIMFVQSADQKTSRFTSYAVALRILHISTLSFFVGAFLYAIWLASQ